MYPRHYSPVVLPHPNLDSSHIGILAYLLEDFFCPTGVSWGWLATRHYTRVGHAGLVRRDDCNGSDSP